MNLASCTSGSHWSGSLGAGVNHRWVWGNPLQLPLIHSPETPIRTRLSTHVSSPEWSLHRSHKGFKGKWLRRNHQQPLSEGQTGYSNTQILHLPSSRKPHCGGKGRQGILSTKILFFSSRLMYLINTSLIRGTQETFAVLNTREGQY